jgi:hypothetical protein
MTIANTMRHHSYDIDLGHVITVRVVIMKIIVL